MHKRGLVNTAFRCRWFILKQGTLRYYKQESDGLSGPPQGSLSMREAAVYPLPNASDGRWAFQSERTKTRHTQ
eukprot:4532893-Prymnesium_polylepis.1